MEQATITRSESLLGSYSHLIEDLYASLMDNKGFDHFLNSFREHFKCNSATLMAVQNNPRHMRYGWSVGIPDEHLRWYIENDMVSKDPSIDLYVNTCEHVEGFVSLGTQFEGIELIETVDDDFKPWIESERVVDVAGLVIPSAADEKMILALQRNADHGQFRKNEIYQLNLLSPHIKQAVQLFNRLYQQHNDNSSLQAAINTLSQPTIVINELMQVRHINTAAKTLIDNCHYFDIDDEKFLITDEAAHHKFMFQAWDIAKTAENPANELTSTITITTESAPVTITLSPLYSNDNGTQSKGVLLQIFDPNTQTLPKAEKIQSIFQLSNAEAKLCEMLVEGLPLKMIAAKRDVSINTVREQMRKVFTKTGYNRQSELVAAILRAVP